MTLKIARYSVNQINNVNNKRSICTIGAFDALHIGHISLIRQLVSAAKSTNKNSVVVSFYPHPKKVLSNSAISSQSIFNNGFITGLRERVAVLDQLGVDFLYLVRFTKKLSQLTADEFLEKVLDNKLNCTGILIGPDLSIGKDKLGTPEVVSSLSAKRGWDVIKADLVMQDSEIREKISTSRIKDLLSQGDIVSTNQLLGRAFSISGYIRKGDQRGRQIGFPTINLFQPNIIPLKSGVYAGYALIDDYEYKAVINIGIRPTFLGDNQISKVKIEAHLLDTTSLALDDYGKSCRLSFISRLRDEKKFSDISLLIEQIKKDIELANQIFNEVKDSTFKFILSAESESKRLDLVVPELLSLSTSSNSIYYKTSRSQFKKMIEEKRVFINDSLVTKAGQEVSAGDEITILAKFKEEEFTPFEMDLDILFRDKDLVVLNKPAGIPVHPGAGTGNKTIVNALISNQTILTSSFDSHSKALMRPGVVHRLDKDTTGVMVIALNQNSLAELSRQFQERIVEKRYIALAIRKPRGGLVFDTLDFGIISAPIGRSDHDKTSMQVANSGRQAITHWHVLERYEHAVLLELDIKTGRTHQIRVHLEHVGSGVIGDKKYGNFDTLPEDLRRKSDKFSRQALHAKSLSFEHPTSKEKITFSAPIPDDMLLLIESFKS